MCFRLPTDIANLISFVGKYVSSSYKWNILLTKDISNALKLGNLWCVWLKYRSPCLFFPDLVTGSGSANSVRTARGLSTAQREACMRSLTTQKPKRLPRVNMKLATDSALVLVFINFFGRCIWCSQTKVLINIWSEIQHTGYHKASLIARLWGQHGAHLGPTGPRLAPCWPHEACYLGSRTCYGLWSLHYYYQLLWGKNMSMQRWQNNLMRLFRQSPCSVIGVMHEDNVLWIIHWVRPTCRYSRSTNNTECYECERRRTKNAMGWRSQDLSDINIVYGCNAIFTWVAHHYSHICGSMVAADDLSPNWRQGNFCNQKSAGSSLGQSHINVLWRRFCWVEGLLCPCCCQLVTSQ